MDLKGKKRIGNLIKISCLLIFLVIGIFFSFKSKIDEYHIDTYTLNDSFGREMTVDLDSDYSYMRMKKNDWIDIVFKLPEADSFVNVLAMNCKGFKIDVYSNGQNIYTNEDKVENAKYIDAIEYIPIQEDYLESEVRLRLIASENMNIKKAPDIYFMRETKAYEEYLANNLLKILCALMFIFAGIVVICFELFRKKFDLEDIRITVLCVFCVIIGIWLLSYTNYIYILFNSWIVNYWMRHLSVFISFILLLLYIYCTYKWDFLVTKKVISVIKIDLIVYLIAILLQITGVVSFKRFSVCYYVLSIFNIIYLGKVLIKHFNKKRLKKNILAGIVIVICTVVLHIILEKVFQYKIGFLEDNGLPYAVIAFCILLMVRHIYEILEEFIGNNEHVRLENLAYIDVLTGIANRNMCEKKFEEIDNEITGIYTIIMFDINGLKHVNDNFGHSSGDELIYSFSKILKNVFSEEKSFIGRMGGDEFVVIVYEKYKDEVEAMLNNLEKYTTYINDTNQYRFTIKYSYGISVCDRTRNNTMWKKYSQADSKMYQMKK